MMNKMGQFYQFFVEKIPNTLPSFLHSSKLLMISLTTEKNH